MKTKQVISEIKNQLKIPMEQWVEAQVQRIEVLIDYKKSEAYSNIEAEFVDNGFGGKVRMTKSENQFWHLQSLGYSKKDMQMVYHFKNDIKIIYEKEAANKLLRVDVAVNKKLKDLDIKSIDQIGFRHGLDGFIEGDWIITTKDGKQFKFRFETFFAGGYNIQCLHIRTKYQLKEMK